MDQLKLSIIVPAYNAEQYLQESVDSVFLQSYNNYEIILIDDGSKDNTGKICDDLARKDSRVKVIHQKNGGRSVARNSGIKIATGDYIGYLDADDFYAKDALGNIVSCIEKNGRPDLFLGRFESFSEGTDFEAKDNPFDSAQINGKCRNDVLSYLLSIPFMYTQCRYYIKSELLKRKELEFVPGLDHEDEAWTPVALMSAESFCALEKPFYIYRVHSNSFMTTVSVKKQIDKLWIANKFCDDQKQFHTDDIRYALLESRIQQLTLSAVSESFFHSKSDLRDIAQLCAELNMKKPSSFVRLPKLQKLATVLGWKNAMLIMSLYIRMRNKMKKGRIISAY